MSKMTTGALQDLVYQQRSVGTLLENRAAQYAGKTFLKWEGTEISYREIDQMANRVANSLLALGVHAGDRVAIMMANSPEWVGIWLGTAKIGAVIVPINSAYKGAGLSYQLRDSQASVLVIDGSFAPRLEILDPKPYIPHIFVGGDSLAPVSLPAAAPLGELFGSADTAPPDGEVSAQSPGTILYTSGTTGPPKGCLLPHGQYLAAAFLHAANCGYGPDTTVYTCLPLVHVNAQNYTVLSALAAGGAVALDARFTASRFWNRLIETRATAFNFIGSMAVSLWNQEASASEKQHDARVAFGVPVPVDIWAEWEERFNCKIVYAYGMTENALPAIVSLENTPVPPHLRGSAGIASPTSEVAIVDDNDLPVPAGTLGEIVTRPKIPWTMMSEYVGKPEATIEAFRGCWFHTGDLGYLDEDGYLFFVDRMKDALRRKGEMVSSWEVETTVAQFPQVADCAVVAVPSELGEDEIMVVVVPKGASFDPAELIGFCEDRMAGFQVPRYVRFVDALPRTQTQRVEKYRLRQEGVPAGTWDALTVRAPRLHA